MWKFLGLNVSLRYSWRDNYFSEHLRKISKILDIIRDIDVNNFIILVNYWESECANTFPGWHKYIENTVVKWSIGRATAVNTWRCSASLRRHWSNSRKHHACVIAVLLTSTDTPRDDASDTVSIVQFHRNLSSDPRLCLRHCSTPYPAYCIVHVYCARSMPRANVLYHLQLHTLPLIARRNHEKIFEYFKFEYFIWSYIDKWKINIASRFPWFLNFCWIIIIDYVWSVLHDI